jgi:hypothetical protein
MTVIYYNNSRFDPAINHGDIVAAAKRHFSSLDFLFWLFSNEYQSYMNNGFTTC